MNLDKFSEFFDCCLGSWITERTYHYLAYQEVERSHTEFKVNPLEPAVKSKVFADNNYSAINNLTNIPGFNLDFHTISEKGVEVSQSVNLLFVPNQENQGIITGDYLRDKAYEEDRPMISHFRFNSQTKELLMTTNYTRVVSVDSITLVNPNLRIRKIVNYQRPPEGDTLDTVVLVGFGVEQKV